MTTLLLLLTTTWAIAAPIHQQGPQCMEGPTTPYGNRIVTSAFLIYGNFYDEIYSSRVDEPSAIGKCRIFASECRQQIESGNKLAYRECAALHGGPAVTTDR